MCTKEDGGDRARGERGSRERKSQEDRRARGRNSKKERGGQWLQWPQPHLLFRQLPPGSPSQVSAAVRAEEEREARHQQTAW